MPKDRALFLNGEIMPESSFIAVLERGSGLYVNGKRYRGELIVKAKREGLLVINRLDIEEYLGGVLPGEVPFWWPMEALKAQAVAARTYACYYRFVNRNNEYDLRDDVYSQVYKGKNKEKFKTYLAVKATSGEVLTYKDKIFPAYFHSTCAGHTENALILWDVDIEPLRGVSCPYCSISPFYKWKRVISKKIFIETLNSSGYNFRDIDGVRVKERNQSSRAKEVVVEYLNGKEIVFEGGNFRYIMGSKIALSSNFEVSVKNGEVIFEGKGWGHGVGLCQWGCYGMALKDYGYKDILEFYYPGAEISPIESVKGYYETEE
jgi:stage II sporulation protein D